MHATFWFQQRISEMPFKIQGRVYRVIGWAARFSPTYLSTSNERKFIVKDVDEKNTNFP